MDNLSFGHESLWLSSASKGTVLRVDPDSGTVEASYLVEGPTAVLALPDQSALVATSSGDILRLHPESARPTVAVRDLERPTALLAAEGDSVYVAESAAGTVVRLALGSGRRWEIASGLAGPASMSLSTLSQEDRIVLVEADLQTLLEIDLETGARTIVTDRLALAPQSHDPDGGLQAVPGVAVARDGTIYVSSTVTRDIYRLRPQSTAGG